MFSYFNINTSCLIFTIITALIYIVKTQRQGSQTLEYAGETGNCSSKCRGDYCHANCSGTMAETEAIGFGAISLVFGDLSKCECFGPFCESICDGVLNICLAKCSGRACKAMSEGISSTSSCLGHKCNSNCTGERCVSMCEGTNCLAECHSKQCKALCVGAACESQCSGTLCDRKQS